jgi:cytochrome c oxidase subunit 2
MHQVPNDAIEVNVINKQWMRKVQHADGRRESTSCVPTGRPVPDDDFRDVIHGFVAFRMKQDVVPASTLPGSGRPRRPLPDLRAVLRDQHSGMIGWVHAMERGLPDVARGRDRLGVPGVGRRQTLPAARLQHVPPAGLLARGPNLEGLFGKQVQLAGRTVVADELPARVDPNPNAKTVAGFQPIMPRRGLVSEEELLQLVAYVSPLEAAGFLHRRTRRAADAFRKNPK